MFGKNAKYLQFHLVLSVEEVVELIATTAMEKVDFSKCNFPKKSPSSMD